MPAFKKQAEQEAIENETERHSQESDRTETG